MTMGQLTGATLAALVGTFGLAGEAIAQVPILPDPGRIQQELQPPSPPTAPEQITVPQQEGVEAPADSQQIRFLLREVELKGVSVFAVEELRPLYAGQLGTEISLADLYTIAAEIQKFYRRRGYLFTRVLVPAQTITEGKVTLEVVEGFIEEVEIEGATPAQERRLQGFIRRLKASRPLKVSVLERNLLLMNDLAGYRVRAQLRAGQERGGTVLRLLFSHTAVNSFFEMNNWAPDTVGPVRAQAGLFLNSLMNQGERITLSGASVPFQFSELASGRFELQLPVGSDGFTLTNTLNYTTVEPAGNLQAFRIQGRSLNFSTGFSYPVVRSRRLNLFVSGFLDITNSTTDSRFLGPAVTLSQDRVRHVRVGMSIDNVNRVGFTAGSILLSQGLDAFDARLSGTPDAPLSRANGSATAFKANFNFTQLFLLPKGFNGLLTGTAQVASTSLLATEQFGLGGPFFGSAYLPSQITGDDGYGLRFELQRPFRYQAETTPMLSQPYAFADFGQVFIKRPTVAERPSQELASVGFGLRHFFGNSVQLRLELGFPLTRVTPGFERTPQFHFSLQGTF